MIPAPIILLTMKKMRENRSSEPVEIDEKTEKIILGMAIFIIVFCLGALALLFKMGLELYQ